jgi:molybdopterin-synthase adenylyltransferase
MLYSAAMPTPIHESAIGHLVREDGQEDLCFALWFPSQGKDRLTALVRELILPLAGERMVHGNASFQPVYFQRALGVAINAGAGLAFLHSHPAPGWQGMSTDDIQAEEGHAAATQGATGFPLLGLTAGNDGAWSARLWEKVGPRRYERRWCRSVRVVGDRLAVTFHPDLAPLPAFRTQLERTVSAWGPSRQAQLSRLTVGVVGAGSVGAPVAEALARMGIARIRLLDFDSVRPHNLDRLLHATTADAAQNRSKVYVLSAALRNSATADDFRCEPMEWSVVEEEGYRAALDCDVLFSCVDRPWPRSVLNFIAYGHLIPVIDGGIQLETQPGNRGLRRADWRAHVAAPNRRCLECLGQYDAGLVQAEREGYFENPTYIAELPTDHPIRRNENVFAFSLAAASLEVLQFLSMVIAPGGIGNPGAQIQHFITGTIDRDERSCNETCLYPTLIARGDCAGVIVTGKHPVAAGARDARQASNKPQGGSGEPTAPTPVQERRKVGWRGRWWPW